MADFKETARINKSFLDSKLMEVAPLEFYSDLFRDGLDIPEAYTKGSYTGIVIEKVEDKFKRYNITDGLVELHSLIDNSDGFCFMSPISYAGKRRTKKNARFLFALAIDLDGLKVKNGEATGLRNLFHQISNDQQLPPSYIVFSGSGIHLYYIFDKPVPLYKENIRQLEEIRNKLIKRIWNDAITNFYEKDKIQWENLYQGFRVAGTNTKSNDGTKCVVYKFANGDKLSIDDFCRFFEIKNEIKPQPKHSLSELKEKYPVWYSEHFDKDGNSLKNFNKKYWVCNRAVYDWWKKRIENEIFEGHRYYALMCLSVYALKCNISYKELKRDCYSLLDLFESRTENPSNHFTEYDVKCALSSYKNENLKSMSTYTISRNSGLEIKRNKRNGRKLETHVKIMTATRDIIYPDGSWRNPKKDKLVIEWKKANPDKTISQCAKELKISRTTIYKYWNLDVKDVK